MGVKKPTYKKGSHLSVLVTAVDFPACTVQLAAAASEFTSSQPGPITFLQTNTLSETTSANGPDPTVLD